MESANVQSHRYESRSLIDFFAVGGDLPFTKEISHRVKRTYDASNIAYTMLVSNEYANHIRPGQGSPLL